MPSHKKTVIGFSMLGMLYAFAPYAGADTVSNTARIPLSVTNWSKSIAIDKFPASQGSLVAVTFTLNSTISGVQKIESLDSSGAVVKSTLAAQIHLKRPDGTVLLMHTPGVAVTNAFTAFDGTKDYEGTSGATNPIATTSTGATMLMPLSTSDAALFSGEGKLNLPITATAISTLLGAGNLDAVSTLSASADVVVTYAYVNPDLSIRIVPTGKFDIGQTETYMLNVTNGGSGPTVGQTTVITTIPGGLVPVQASGADWSCATAGQTVKCVNESVLPAGASFPEIAVQVAVASGSFPNIVAAATVATGNDVESGNNADSVTIPIIAGSSAPSSGGQSSIEVTGGGGGGGSGERGRAEIATPFTFSNTIGAFGGPAGDDAESVVDAQGCALGDGAINPVPVRDLRACLAFVPDRPLTFSDIAGDPNARFIESLRKTQIADHGDFVVSGAGNPSSGKQQAEYRSGSFPFLPEEPVSRFEAVKIAMLSNCLPIPDVAPRATVTFSDVPVDDSSETGSFVARTLYQAAERGIARGFGDGTFRANVPATNAESLVMLLRAADAMPHGLAFRNAVNWYDSYVAFAHEQNLIPNMFDPNGMMTRSAFSELVVHVMALARNPAVSSYVSQLDVSRQAFTPHALAYAPLKLAGSFLPIDGLSCDMKDPLLNSCMQYVPDRPIAFVDVKAGSAAARSIDLLKKTALVPDGDFIVSGVGNHSTGKQQAAFRSGDYPFDPDHAASRLEVVKTALVSNCVPVLDYIPRTDVIFRDVNAALNPSNELQDFTSRVFYTAALFGIVKGDENANARPFETVTRSEALLIMLRAADALPKNFTPSHHPFSDVAQTDELAPSLSFAAANGILPETWKAPIFQPTYQVTRAEMSVLLTNIMQWSSDIRIRAYRAGVAPLLR